MEIWKTIINYENYEVSNYGRIRSFVNNKLNKRKEKKIIKPILTKYGYYRLTLCNEEGHKIFNVHRLVAQAFLENYDEKLQVNHKDENKINNNVDNLEMCNSKYNCNYGTRNKKISEKTRNKKISEKDRKRLYDYNINKMKKVYCFENNKTYISINEAGRNLKLNSGNIALVCSGKRKTTGNYHFKYI